MRMRIYTAVCAKTPRRRGAKSH